jgi:hypothetical protein
MARIVGFVCLGLALLNVTFGVLVMVAEKSTRSGRTNLVLAASLAVIGMVNLTRSKRRAPDATPHGRTSERDS